MNRASHQILSGSNTDTNDFFAILDLLKKKRSYYNLGAINTNANTSTEIGHSVSQTYDILYMMGHDEILVRMGESGI